MSKVFVYSRQWVSYVTQIVLNSFLIPLFHEDLLAISYECNIESWGYDSE